MADVDIAPLSKLRIIWIAFFVAVCVYALLPWLLIGDRLDSAAPDTESLRSGLQAGAIGVAMASFLAKRRWTKLLLQSDAAPSDRWTQLQLGCVVTWLITEVVGLIGLAIALVTRHAAEGVPYAGAALFLLYMHRLDMWPVPTDGAAAPSEGA